MCILHTANHPNDPVRKQLELNINLYLYLIKDVNI